MKFLTFLVLSFLIISCNSDSKKEYAFNELTVNFVRGTRVTTFVREGKPISGMVTQNLRNGGKAVWDVENGLATKQTRYYPNGQVARILEMKNGVENGIFIMYYSNGEKQIEQFYEKGEPVGTWHRWNSEGELVETIEH